MARGAQHGFANHFFRSAFTIHPGRIDQVQA
jgi:hypothetical protein